jgi:FKBP-type peptidyl-prolyl cis-trans isomerase
VKPYLAIIVLLPLLIFSSACKKKNLKKPEDLPTKVEAFDGTVYRQSTLDSGDLASMKRFGSVYDSAKYQADLDSIGAYFEAQDLKEVFFSNSGVVYAVKKYGKGIYPVAGDKLHVYTETKRWDGKLVFSSAKYQQPLEFILGTGQVVPAWDEILPNIPEGSEVLIIAPSAMSYGKKAIPKTLPGNSILIYDIKLSKVFPATDTPTKSTQPLLKIKGDNENDKEPKSKIPSTIRRPDAP